uniref:Hyaluronan/mRNA-binding protein domain-containing protein n=1 Tax=Microcebus murinus TaxID=30608 RepID=A0A8C5W7Z4_MICMU
MPGHLQEGFSCMDTNRFDQVFDHESDPFEVLKAAENKKKEAGGGGVGGPRAKREAQARTQTNSYVAGKQLRKESQKALGGHGGKIIDRRPERRPPQERIFEKPLEEKGEGGEFSADRPIIDRPILGRGEDGFDSRVKREFDRHSGSDRSSFSHYSGLKHEDKCGGSRSHNWGTVKDELTDLDQSNVTEETPEVEEHLVADTENKENEVEEVKEEGPKKMTLDEWKAIQNKDRAKVEFNIRKPNEGADGPWKKGFVLHKSKSKEAHAEDSVMDHHFWKPTNDITSQLEINFGDLGRPGHGAGLTSQMLLLLMWTTQRHSQLRLNWTPQDNPGFFVDPSVQSFCMLKDSKQLKKF